MMNDNIQTKRLLALDVMRGITMAGMVLVNNPGDWENVYAPLRHAAWNGLTPTDLVFPFFMFVMGVSMSFSFDKFGNQLTAPFFRKLVKRTVILFLLGVLMSLYGLVLNRIVNYDPEVSLVPWSEVRILGVLQRLALTYFLGALLVIGVRRCRTLLVTSALILVLYYIILALGNGFDLSEANIIAVIDRSLWGTSHMYTEWLPDGTTVKFDPEGLLSTLPGIAHVALGYVCGKIIRTEYSLAEKTARLSVMGIVLLFAGYLFSYGCPINKAVWSPTFVLVACGSASLFLSLLVWIIDVRGFCSWITPFQAIGSNPLFIYLLASLLAITLSYCGIHSMIYAFVVSVVPGGCFASLVYGLLYVLFNGLIAYWLFRRKIYIKV